MFTLAFWKATAERALKTLAQVFILKVVGEGVESSGFDASAVDWADVGWYCLGGVLLSVAFSIISAKATGDGPSLTNSEVLSPPAPPPPPGPNEVGAFDTGILITIAAVVVIVCGVIFIAQAL